jgi:hypothetical protein
MGKAKEGKIKTWGEGKADDSASSGGGAGGGAGGAGGGAGGGGSGGVPFSQVIQEAFKDTGITVKIPAEMGNIKRDFWSMKQSPADFAQAMAKELGGSFKISNGVAVFIKKGSGLNADGMPLVDVEAVWGVNLIGWRIKPYAGRAQWGGAISNHFDIFGGVWEKAEKMIGGSTPFGSATAQLFNPMPMANQAVGEQMNTGSDRDSQSRRGTGWILLNGEPTARAGAHIFILNARPGVDGKYMMKEVEHNYTRGVGFTTRANVEYPEPFRGGFGWTRDPGNTGNMNTITKDVPKDVEPQSTDPNAPGYVAPLPPGSDKAQSWTPEQLEAMRKAEAEKKLPETYFMPGRSPGFGMFGGPPSAEDKVLAQNWFKNRNMPIPPQWQ